MSNLALVLLAWGLLTAYFLYRAIRGEADRKNVSWVELFEGRFSPLSKNTKSFMRRTFGDQCTIPNIIVYSILSALTAVALSAEFTFLQRTLELLLEETAESFYVAIFGFQLYGSHLISLMMSALSALVGLVVFPERQGVRRMEFHKITHPTFTVDLSFGIPAIKVAAWSILSLLCIVECYLGYSRGIAFQVWQTLVSQIGGTTTPVPTAETTETMRLLNAVVSGIIPIVAAFTCSFLIRLTIWVISVPVSILLAVFVWLPDFVLDGIIRRRGPKGPTDPGGGSGSSTPNSPTTAEEQEHDR